MGEFLTVHDAVDHIARFDRARPGLAVALLDELSGEDALDIWQRWLAEEQAVAAAEAVVARYERLHPDEEDP